MCQLKKKDAHKGTSVGTGPCARPWLSLGEFSFYCNFLIYLAYETVNTRRAAPTPRLIKKKVIKSIWKMKPIPARRQDMPLINSASLTTLSFAFPAKAKLINKLDNPRNNVHPSMFMDARKEVGFAWRKCSRPSSCSFSKAHLTELICPK